MEVIEIVGNLAFICTILSFLSGAQICLKFRKSGSTGKMASLPFIAGLFCSILWLRYGLYLKDNNVIWVNLIGATLQTIYIGIFYYYATNRTSLYKQLGLTGLFLVALFINATCLVNNQNVAINMIGLAACAASLFACASPMASLSEVFKSKSCESLPFPIILAGFVVTSLWFAYGFLLNDTFMEIPNFIGATLSGFQLSLFAIYPSKRVHSELTPLFSGSLT